MLFYLLIYSFSNIYLFIKIFLYRITHVLPLTSITSYFYFYYLKFENLVLSCYTILYNFNFSLFSLLKYYYFKTVNFLLLTYYIKNNCNKLQNNIKYVSRLFFLYYLITGYTLHYDYMKIKITRIT